MRKKQPTIEYNPSHESHGYKVRFVENASRGLRRIGFADEVIRNEGYPRAIDHKGWFTDDEGNGEVYRGVVYALPGRHGAPQYVYGYDDPCNDDCALLCFDPVEDKQDAARQADRFAEIFAEHEREFNRAWQAGRDVERLNEEIKEARTEVLELGAEMRRAAKFLGRRPPAICAVLREKIRALYHEIQKARKERKELTDNYGDQPGFEE